MKEKLEKNVRWKKEMLRELENNFPQKKKSICIRLDEDVLSWFKAQGQGYQTYINAVLKTYMRNHK